MLNTSTKKSKPNSQSAKEPQIPEVIMPAMPPVELLEKIASRYKVWKKHHSVRKLQKLNDEMIHCMGFRSEEIALILSRSSRPKSRKSFVNEKGRRRA